MSLNLKNDILNAAKNGYQPIGDPTIKEVNWPKPPTSGSNAVRLNPDCVSLTTGNAFKGRVSLTLKEFNNLVELIVDQTKRIAELEFKLAKNGTSKVKVNKLRCRHR